MERATRMGAAMLCCLLPFDRYVHGVSYLVRPRREGQRRRQRNHRRSHPLPTPGGGAAAVSVIILAEVMQYTMSTLEYLRNKWVKPLIARHRAQGRAEGRAEMYDELRKWLERREAAEQAGLPFHEPPPTPDKKD